MKRAAVAVVLYLELVDDCPLQDFIEVVEDEIGTLSDRVPAFRIDAAENMDALSDEEWDA
jgi:hypothetical protein